MDHLPPSELIGSVELAGPGFINILLADRWLQGQVATVLQAGEAFGAIEIGKASDGRSSMSAPTRPGPLHYGGARNADPG